MTSRPRPAPAGSAPPAPAPARDAFAAAADRLAAQRPLRHAGLQKIAAAIQSHLLPLARLDLQAHLAHHPADADALLLLSRVAARQGQAGEAIDLLARCVACAPDFSAARFQRAHLLYQAHRYAEALAELETLLAQEPANPLFLQLQAVLLESTGDGERSVALCERLVDEHPTRAESWVRCGHARRATGRQAECIEAYRRAIALRPGFGPAWWSLANLKTFRFGDDELDTLRGLLAQGGLPTDDRIPLQFALAKALEDRGEDAAAFALYSDANAILRQRIEYDPRTLSAGVARNKALFTAEFFARRAGTGHPTPDPIFVLGRPRSGSTLVEQILASHPAIEGTAELPYVADLAARTQRGPGPAYDAQALDALAALPDDTLASYGASYLQSAQVHRRLGRPRFVDKRPANASHLALIHLMLPNAKIIDVRRHPAATCLSIFTSYSLKARLSLPELGRFYRDYVELMAHFDEVLPGRVHRVIYEELVADPEGQTRRLLDHLGLPFDPACLRFHETPRTMLTPSSEQARQPITRAAVDHWRRFEPWLGPLFESLGPTLEAYPDAAW